MTELEKAKAGNYAAIDLNKLAEEIRIENNKYLAEIRKTSSFDEFKKIDTKVHMKPAETMLQGINAFIMKVTVQEPLIAQYAAALGVSKLSLLNASNFPFVKPFAEIVEAALTEVTTTISIKVPNTD